VKLTDALSSKWEQQKKKEDEEEEEEVVPLEISSTFLYLSNPYEINTCVPFIAAFSPQIGDRTSSTQVTVYEPLPHIF
jgi:hypothetical protein